MLQQVSEQVIGNQMGQAVLPSTADHLISIAGSDWAFWRWVCLRSPGFPADGVLKLAASPDLISAVDEVIRSVRAMELTRQEVLDQINSALDFLKSSGRWDDKKTRKALLDARTRVNAQKAVPHRLPEMVSSESIEKLRTAIQLVETSRLAFEEKFSISGRQTTEAIREIVGSPAFREAITWQNRAALQTAIDPLLRNSLNGSSRSSKDRQHEELVASYWQRYCTKNDTIGFFGPVGWAQFAPDIAHLDLKVGRSLLATRKTYWENWAIEVLGEVITRKYNVQPWIPPILMPFVRVTGTVLHHPVWGAVTISAKQATLLRACNGQDTAKQIAAKLLGMPGAHFRSEDEVYGVLRELCLQHLVFWKFNIPLDPYPEQVLREALQRIEDLNIRTRALNLLGELDSAKTHVETSAGNPEKLNLALHDLEQVFTRLTDVAATRNPGLVYGGRTLVYEDCRRDVEVRLGPDLLNSIAEPMSLLLHCGRWFTSRIAEVYKQKILQTYSELVRSTANTVVDAAVLWKVTSSLFFSDARLLINPVVEEFRIKWERILQLRSSRDPVVYSCDELRPRIMKEFPASRRGWIGACYHSPDIMIASASKEAIMRGDYFAVLGEVHVGVNTLTSSLFVNQHPSPHELLDAVARDLGPLNVIPVGIRTEDTGSRTAAVLIPQSNPRLEFLPDSFVIDRGTSLPVSSMVLEKHNGELITKTRDGRFRVNAIDLVSSLLSVRTIDCFRIIAPLPHVPRISIDRLVIRRESWRFSPSELQFAQCVDAAERFLKARTWARENGIPRFAFFKVSIEKKPAYVDFDSPILVEIFAKMVRRTMDGSARDATVDISEMLPTFDQLWLTDAQNRRYTTELRLVAVDTAGVPEYRN